MVVKNYLSKNVKTIEDLNTTLEEISILFLKEDLNTLVVLKDKKPIYILTNTDILNLLLSEDKNTTLKGIIKKYPKEIITAPEDIDIYTAYNLMREKHVNHLIIVNKKGEFIGVLSQKDMVYYLVDFSLKDELTELYNKRFLEIILDKYANLNQKVGVIFIDVDKFKNINDTFGHKKGDEILKFIADSIKKSIRKSDFAFRFGGDEFIVLIINQNNNIVKEIAKRIFENISKNKKFDVNVSMGVAFYPDEINNLYEVFKIADKKLYKAKEKRGRIIF